MEFSMQVADAKALQEEVFQEVKVIPEEANQLKSQAENNVEAIMKCDLDSLAERNTILQSIEQFGFESMQQSSKKNGLLKVKVGNLSQAGNEGGEISKGLMDLHKEIKDLDPSLVDFTKTGVLGKVFNPLRAYFAKYEKAEDVIDGILKSLEKGKKVLKNDNTTLSIEQQSLRELTKRINKEIEMGTQMDDCIAARIDQAEVNGEDPDKIKFVQEEILFPLRQRIMDMQQMVVVNNQGIVAMEIVQRNNKELMRGIDRATTVTVSALRTAVMVASALYNQKIVLKKIQALNETTNSIISSTSKMLKDQGAEIQRQSMDTGVSVDTLKSAFADLTTALEEISTYKQKALPVMKDTIEQFKELAEKGEAQISQLERGSAITM